MEFRSLHDLLDRIDMLYDDSYDEVGAEVVGGFVVSCSRCSDNIGIFPIRREGGLFLASLLGMKSLFRMGALESDTQTLSEPTFASVSWNKKVTKRPEVTLDTDRCGGYPQGTELLGLVAGRSLDDVAHCIAVRTWREVSALLPTQDQIHLLEEIVQTIILSIVGTLAYDAVKAQVRKHLESTKTPEQRIEDFLQKTFGLEHKQFDEMFVEAVINKVEIQLRIVRETKQIIPRIERGELYCVYCGLKMPYDSAFCPNCRKSKL
jgi:hypothetical protein